MEATAAACLDHCGGLLHRLDGGGALVFWVIGADGRADRVGQRERRFDRSGQQSARGLGVLLRRLEEGGATRASPLMSGVPEGRAEARTTGFLGRLANIKRLGANGRADSLGL